MSRFIVSFLTILLFVGSSRGQESSTNEAREGQALAAEMRSLFPEQNSEVRGVLKIRSPKEKITNNVPVIAKVVVGDGHWESIYETAPTLKSGAERLVIRHFRDRPNVYLYARAASPSAPLPFLENLDPEKVNIPLAGSDFSLADLGLDFLHWPVQRRLKDDKRLDRSCFVLESSHAKRIDPVTVKSSIDKESHGILVAEAFDLNGKQVKEFTLSGTGFRKVNGQWQLQRMEIYDRRRGSKTTLEFDPPPKTP